MDSEEAQSMLQGLTVAAIVLAVVVGGFTYVTEGAANWRLVWIMVFLVTLPGLLYVYLRQE